MPLQKIKHKTSSFLRIFTYILTFSTLWKLANSQGKKSGSTGSILPPTCASTFYTTFTVSNYQVIVGDILTIPITGFSLDPINCPVSYNFFSTAPVGVSTFNNADPSNLYVTIDATDTAILAGHYLCTIFGQDSGLHNTGQFIGYTSFVIDVLDNCDRETITNDQNTHGPTTSIDYVVGSSVASWGFNPLSSSKAACLIDYELVEDPYDVNSPIGADPTFYIDPATLTIKAYTTDGNKEGSYDMRIRGVFDGFTLSAVSPKFTLNVIDCQKASVSITSPFTTVDYYLFDSIMTKSYSGVSITDAKHNTYCAPSSTSISSAVLSHEGYSAPSFTIQTDNIALLGTSHSYTINAWLDNYPSKTASFTFTVNVLNPCTKTANVHPATVATKTYRITVMTLDDFHIDDFTDDYNSHSNFCGPFGYSCKFTDGTALSGMFSFNAALQQFYVDPSYGPYLSVTYNIDVTGCMTNDPTYACGDTYFDVIWIGCDQTVISTVTVSNQAFTIVDQSDITFNANGASNFWTESFGVCGAFTYTLEISTDGGSSYTSTLPSYIEFDDTTLEFIVHRTQIVESTNYYVRLKGQLEPSQLGPSANKYFTLDAIGCDATVITEYDITDKTYTFMEVVSPFFGTFFTESFGVCGPFTYSATSDYDGRGSLPSFITFDPVTLQFIVDTTQITDSLDINIVLEGSLPYPGPSKTIDFKISLIGCDVTTFTTPAISDITYTINQASSLSFIPTAFSELLGVCGPFTYDCIKQDGSSLPSPLFSFDPLTRQFSIDSTQITIGDTYNLKMVGTIQQYPYTANQVLFIVTTIGCDSTVITASSLTNQDFIYNLAPTTYSFLDFTESLNECSPFTYSATLADGDPLPSPISFDPITRQFTVDTSLITMPTTTYSLKVKGSLASPYPFLESSSFDFVLTACDTTVITVDPISDATFTYLNTGVTTDTITFIDWTESLTSCGLFTYTVTQQDGSALPSPLISFDSSTLTFTIDKSLITTTTYYNIKIVGAPAVGGLSLTVTFRIDLIGCNSAVITTTGEGTHTLHYQDSTQTFYLTDFTEDIGTCGPFTYTATLSDGVTALPGLLTFNDGTGLEYFGFTVDTNAISTSTTYSIIVVGTLPSPGGTSFITFDIVLGGCDQAMITTYPQPAQTFTFMEDNSYSASRRLLASVYSYFYVDEFTESMGVCTPFTYTATLSDGSPLPALLTMAYMGGYYPPIQFTIDTSLIVLSNTITVKLIGTLPSPGSSSFILFDVIFIGCDQTSISTTFDGDQYFTVYDSTNYFYITAFTESLGVCGDFTYTSTQVDGSALPSSIISFDDSYLTFNLNTANIIETRDYSIRVFGVLAYPGPSSHIDFVLHLTACDTTVLSPSYISDQSFKQNDALQTFSMTDFTESFTLCGLFTYTITKSDGSAVPSLLTLDTTSLTFTVDTALILVSDTYTIKVNGDLAAPGGDTFTTFQLELISCADSVLAAPTISDQVFTILDSSQTFSMTAFTESFNQCGTFTYSIMQSDGSAVPSVLSLDPTSLVFTVDTNNILTSGIFTIKVLGDLASPGLDVFTTFQLQLISCADSVITTYPVTNQQFSKNQASNTFSFTPFTESLNRCSPITYTITQSDGSASPTILTFDSLANLFTVDTTAISSSITYTIKVTGFLSLGGPSSFIQFNLQLIGCDSTTISTQSVSDQTFTKDDASDTFSMNDWSELMGVCGSFTYVATQSDNSALPSILSFNSVSRVFTVATTSITTSAIYTIKVTGSLASPAPTPQSITFILTIIGCDQTVITTNGITTQSFSKSQSPSDFSFVDWTELLTVCGSFSYSALQSDGSALPSLLTFDSTTRTFSVDTSAIVLSTSYTIKLIGALGSPGPSTFVTFPFNVVGCDSTTITSYDVTDQSYIYLDSPSSYSMTAWTESMSVCGAFTYTITQTDGSAIPSILTFNPATLAFSVDTNSIILTTVYHIKVLGALSYPGPSKIETYDLTVTGCDTTTITSPAIPIASYEIDDSGSNTFTIPAWSESLGLCGAFTYSALLSNGLSIPSFLTLDPSTGMFSVDTSLLILTTTYTIAVTGTLPSPGPTKTINFVLSITACDVTTITTQAEPNQVFTVYDSVLTTFQISGWSESLGRCGAITYAATLSDGVTALPSLIALNPTTGLFTVDTYNIVLTTIYNLKLTGILASPGPSSSIYFSLTLIGCDSASITTQSIANQNFIVYQALNTISMNAWTESLTVCGPFTYTATLSSGAALPSIVTFNAATRDFTVATSAIVTTTTYTIKVVGDIPYPGSDSFITFTLHTVGCDSTTITTQALATQNMIVDDVTDTFQITGWTESLGLCGAFTYSATLIDGSSLPSFVVIDPSTGIFTVDTSAIILTHIYSIKAFGTLASPGPSQFITFDLSLTGCDTTVITTYTVTPQTFTVNDVTNSITITDWTEQLGRCTPFTYTALDDFTGLAIPSILTLTSPSSPQFTVDTAAIILTTSYTIRVIGALPSPGPSTQVTYIINTIGCDSTVITPVAPSPSAFTVYDSITTSFQVSGWSELIGQCGSFTYSALQSDGSALPSELTLDPVTGLFTVDTYNIVLTKTYTISLTGTLVSPGPSSTITFSYSTIGCDTTVITSYGIVAQTFTVLDLLDSYSMTPWTESFGICGYFTYTATLSDGSPLPSIVLFDAYALTFTVDTNNLVLTTTYSIKVEGVLDSPGPSSFITYTLHIIACDTTVITSPAIADQTFYIYDTINTFSATAWSESIGRCTPFTYTATQLDGSSLPSPILSFDSTTLIFTVDISYILTDAIYTIKLFADLPSPAGDNFITFILTLISCEDTVITPTAQIDQYFSSGQAITTFTVLPFSESFSVCGAFTYTTTQSDGSALPSILTFNPATLTYTVDVNSIPVTTSYIIKIIGSLASPYPSQFTTFTLDLTGCTSTVIITPVSPTDFDAEYTFTYGDVLQIVNIPIFTEIYNVCGPIFYNSSATEIVTRRMLAVAPPAPSYPSNLPYYILFDKIARTYTIDTFNIYSSSQEQIILQGTLPNTFYNSQIQFLLNIVGCEPAIIQAPTISPYIYYLNNLRVYIPLNEITVSNTLCPYTTTETVRYAKSPSTIYSQSTSTNPHSMIQDSYYHQLQVQTNTVGDIGYYTIFVTVEVKFDPLYDKVTKYVSYQFNIRILGSNTISLINLAPPYFDGPIYDISLYEGQTVNYHIPRYLDSQSLIVYVDVNLGNATNFTQFQSDNFQIKGLSRNIGDYRIMITLTDTDAITPLSSYFYFTISIKSLSLYQSGQLSSYVPPILIDNGIGVNGQNFSSLDLLKLKYFQTVGISDVNTPLISWIQSIDSHGKVKVDFNEKLFVPAEYYFISDQVLELEIRQSTGKYLTKFNWTLTNFTQKSIYIQLNLTDPKLIGMDQESDYLYIKYLDGSLFFTLPSLKSIKKNSVIFKKMPPQISKDDAAKIDFMQYAVNGALPTAVGIGIASSFFFPFTNTFTWMLLSTIQLILHLPLFSIYFPSQGQPYPIEKGLRMAFLVLMTLVPIMCFLFGRFYLKMSTRAKRMISSLYEDLDQDSRPAMQYHTFYMFRRIAFILTAIYLNGYGGLQVQVYMQFSILQLIYCLFIWPYEERKANMLEYFNEGCILTCSYVLIIFTDYVPNLPIKDICGWIIVGILLFNILVNLIIAIYDALTQIGQYLAENCSKNTRKKNKVVDDEKARLQSEFKRKMFGGKGNKVSQFDSVEYLNTSHKKLNDTNKINQDKSLDDPGYWGHGRQDSFVLPTISNQNETDGLFRTYSIKSRETNQDYNQARRNDFMKAQIVFDTNIQNNTIDQNDKNSRIQKYQDNVQQNQRQVQEQMRSNFMKNQIVPQNFETLEF